MNARLSPGVVETGAGLLGRDYSRCATERKATRVYPKAKFPFAKIAGKIPAAREGPRLAPRILRSPRSRDNDGLPDRVKAGLMGPAVSAARDATASLKKNEIIYQLGRSIIASRRLSLSLSREESLVGTKMRDATPNHARD